MRKRYERSPKATARRKAYYLKNRERIRKRQRRYNVRNRERISKRHTEYMREYRKRGQGKRRATRAIERG